MPRRMKRHRRQDRRRSIRDRIARFVRALFSSRPRGDEWDDEIGGLGVREPRRPLRPSMSGAVAVESPTERTDVHAIAEEGWNERQVPD